MSYSNLEVEIRKLKNGAQLIFINDPFALDDSYALSIPFGYFNEKAQSPEGISNLLALSLSKIENKADTATFNRTVLREPQATTWSGLTSNIEEGISVFLNDFVTFTKRINIDQEIQMSMLKQNIR